jgi:hypothetical protein
MTNKFLSKAKSFCPEPGPPASTDHVSPDEGIGLLSKDSLVSTGEKSRKGVVALVKGVNAAFRGRTWKYRAL